MAIIFEKIQWKNFLSTGDTPISINLNTGCSTLIVGPNGAGKSTLLDALSFALFGKPHRDINKPQLVNSVNGKGCEVIVEFTVGKAQFRIVRGIKPSIFEIWQNGTLVNQEAHSMDYQKVLEQNILKLNHKSFHQIVVLGSSSFVPFMQLPSYHRREVIEDLLDINIFTKMNTILKEKIAAHRDDLQALSHSSEINDRTMDMQKKYIGDLRRRTQEAAKKTSTKITTLVNELEQLIGENAKDQEILDANLKTTQDKSSKLHERRQAMAVYQSQIRGNVTKVVKEAQFYENNSECPTCSQKLDAVFREERIDGCKSKAKELAEGQEKIEAEMRKIDDSITEINESLKTYHAIASQVTSRNMAIRRLQTDIAQLEKESTVAGDSDLAEAEAQLEQLLVTKEKLTKDKAAAYEEGSYNQAISEMLKDTGIKTKIIKQYLPVMNKLVNQYLQILDFFVSFNLDESFEETIRSRHRDEFSYSSFSEGEKQRIDLALLFTWRQIAKMKNSVSTNLLVLDETFDSSMDHDGVENLLKILQTLSDGKTSVFVISHKTDALDGKLRNKIEFEKSKNFSQIRQKAA